MESRSENLPITLLLPHRDGMSTARVITEALDIFEAVIDGVTDERIRDRIHNCTDDLADMLRAVR